MRKKILLVIGSLKIGGGAERVVAELGSGLNELDYDVKYLTFTKKKEDEEYDYKGEKLVCDRYNLGITSCQFNINMLFKSKKIADICNKNDIDVVISHLYLPNLLCILSKEIFNHRAKIVVTTHNNPLKKFGKVENYLIKKLYPKSNNVITVSKHTEEIYKSKYSLNDVKTIYNPINLKEIKNLAKKEVDENTKQIFENNFVFITIGSHSKQKAQWYLIRSFKKITETNGNAKLIIIGSGAYTEKLKKLVKRLDIEKEVIFLEWVETVYPYLKKSDCFVLSSLYEGLPMVLIEALSQSTPIISPDCISGPREALAPDLKLYEEVGEYPYFGKYGILTKPFEDKVFFKTLKEKSLSEEEEMLAETMQKMKENGKMRKKYSNGLERAKDFDIKNIVKKWEEIL